MDVSDFPSPMLFEAKINRTPALEARSRTKRTILIFTLFYRPCPALYLAVLGRIEYLTLSLYAGRKCANKMTIKPE